MFFNFFSRSKIPTQISVKVFDQKGIVYQGDAKAVATFNELGEISLLPGHTNFISIIKDKLTLFLAGKEKKEISFATGVMRSFDYGLEIYLGISLKEGSASG